MQINSELCLGCAKCIKFCPMKAIEMENKKAIINQTLCAECGVCHRLAVCETNAFIPCVELPWPRSLRSIFSDPVTIFQETGCSGRGTEEMKTNDVTNRFKDTKYVGIAVDVGRPNVGCSLKDVAKITRVLALLGVEFEKLNPISYLMKDFNTGDLIEEVLDEKVISCVIEVLVPIANVPEVVDELKEVAKDIDTVFSIGIICKVEKDLSIPVIPILEQRGYFVKPSAKTNIGLGKRI